VPSARLSVAQSLATSNKRSGRSPTYALVPKTGSWAKGEVHPHYPSFDARIVCAKRGQTGQLTSDEHRTRSRRLYSTCIIPLAPRLAQAVEHGREMGRVMFLHSFDRDCGIEAAGGGYCSGTPALRMPS
jgi:hypothetical protein